RFLEKGSDEVPFFTESCLVVFPRQRRLPRESDLVVSKRGEMYRFSRDLTPFLPFLPIFKESDPVFSINAVQRALCSEERYSTRFVRSASLIVRSRPCGMSEVSMRFRSAIVLFGRRRWMPPICFNTTSSSVSLAIMPTSCWPSFVRMDQPS